MHPAVEGVSRYSHPSVDHAYPSHVHAKWALLIVDTGVIRQDEESNRSPLARSAGVSRPSRVGYVRRSNVTPPPRRVLVGARGP